MENIVRFAVADNNNFYRLDLSRTLLHFIEYDFTYFWEQCIEAGRSARKNGRLPQNIISNAKTAIVGAHPYIEACINSDYAEIAVDCIIEYICHSERIGLEELWARCISPKNLYETAIFRRISEYKTKRAMNRWASIVRLQEYARNKTEFIYGTDEPRDIISDEIIRARKEYFDLALSVAANEIGCPNEAMPSVRVYSPATLPNAAFAVSKVAKTIYRRFSDVLAQSQDMSGLKNMEKLSDQTAMEAYSYVKNMTRPGELDMNFALETIRMNPPELYMPDSLKAVIDLEFDLMYKNGIVLRKCENCGRYFTAKDDNTRCDRVNSSGKTCRRQYEELCEAIAQEAVKDTAKDTEEPRQLVMEGISPAPVIPEPPKPVPVAVPKETEKRGQKLYSALYKRINKGIDENEFKEWSQYLSNMKRNLKTGEATLAQFEEFLDYSDKLYAEVKIAAKNKTVHAPVAKPDSMKTETAHEAAEGIEIKDILPTAENTEPVSLISADSADVKPFVPQAFDSLSDAVAAGLADDDEKPPVPKKPVEIKKPQWEHLTREDVYGKKE